MKKELKERLEKLGFSKVEDNDFEYRKNTIGGSIFVWNSDGKERGVAVYTGSGKWINFRYEDAIKELENIVRIFEMVI